MVTTRFIRGFIISTNIISRYCSRFGHGSGSSRSCSLTFDRTFHDEWIYALCAAAAAERRRSEVCVCGQSVGGLEYLQKKKALFPFHHIVLPLLLFRSERKTALASAQQLRCRIPRRASRFFISVEGNAAPTAILKNS